MVSEEPVSNESPIPIFTMSSSSAQNTQNLNTHPISSTEIPLIALNITTQINQKLTPSTFPQWRAQFEALIIDYDQLDYVTDISQCPNLDNNSFSAFQKTHWVWQDKLILSAILTSTYPTKTPLIATTQTSHQAWKKLTSLYASRSWTRAMQLKEEITLIQRGNRSITEYFHDVKALADEIANIDHLIYDDDLTLYVLNGLGSNFLKITVPIRARENPLAFEELHDLLIGHHNYLRRLDVATQQLVAAANYTTRKPSSAEGPAKNFLKSNGPNRNNGPGCRSQHRFSWSNNNQRHFKPKCQICDQIGHTTKICRQLSQNEVTVNCAATSKANDQKWLIDSAASLNIIGDLQNLSIHSEYDGTKKLFLVMAQVWLSHTLVL
ncbi:hypothetical protein F2P56_008492 [Juglans regia]|uniref:Retrovirus-related Pol polyprotein from transposon RE1 n=1 Tax=Juglans regia TaxID=51240 RepID=A0A833XUJ1_JUGRE|nr:hypothetical protein F2P56_008492 [Juglans regia]